MNSPLKHLYISPIEKCNLNCKICYTRKGRSQLTQEEILDFVQRYQAVQPLETITFCGGEVFLLPYFIDLLNRLIGSSWTRDSEDGQQQQLLFLQIITNGTIDFLHDIEQPNIINLIVSLDGLPEYHDSNRGPGNFAKSLQFLKKAQEFGFHTEVFSIVTQENLEQISDFEKLLKSELGQLPPITYHPRKPQQYLKKHNKDQRLGQIKNFSFLTKQQRQELARQKKIFPPPGLGCYQISLMADGQVYSCCEGSRSMGKIDDDIKLLIARLRKRLKIGPQHSNTNPEKRQRSFLACPEPDFHCGLDL